TTAPTPVADADGTAADDGATTEDESTTTTVVEGPLAYEGYGGTAEAAGMTWTAQQCAFPDGHRIGDRASEHFSSLAVTGDGVFLAGQDGTEGTGLAKYQPTAGGDGCVLTVDASWGDGGVLHFDREIDYVTGSPSGRLAASRSVFTTWIVDGASGASIECDGGDRTDLSPDGAVAYGHFPGSPELDRYEIDGSGCVVTSGAVTVASQDNPTAGGWIDDDLYLIGGFNDEGASVTALDRSGNERWRAGGSRIDDGETGYGTITAVAPCGPHVCVLDSNFRDVHVLERGGGEQIGLLDLRELSGLPINWFNDLATGPDGALWVAAGLDQLLPSGESAEQIQGLVYRIEIS
ncbi:MAG: hypothetical protein AAGK32_05085, partial [Actinomycetota bacterium]